MRHGNAYRLTVVEERPTGAQGPTSLATLSVREATEELRATWDSFIESHPRASLGHLFDWKRVFEEAYGKRAIFLAALREERCAGVLALVHMKGGLAGNRLVSLPFLDHSGILAADPEARSALWSAALEIARREAAAGIDLRTVGEEGVAAAERSTLILRLPASAPALWDSFPSKVRNQVRKSEREGLATEPAGPDRLGAFHGIFARNMRDLGSPVHSRGFFEALFRALGPRVRLYLTRNRQGGFVGGALAISFRDTVTVPWASSLRDAFPSCPNHSLYWGILSGAVADGARSFDFGRSYADSGTHRFKAQWGAEPLPLSWTSFDPDGKPQAQRILRPGDHPLLTRLWRCLPLAVAGRLGPLLRKHLAN